MPPSIPDLCIIIVRHRAPSAGPEDDMSHRHAHQDIERRPELSQHFFRDGRTVARMVASLPLRRDAPVLDIGAGRGAITEALADAGFRVIAVEKDVRLFRGLRARLIGRTNVECHHADALTMPLPRGRYSVVSNVPFAVTAALVRRLLDGASPPEDAFLVVQREAAEKFAGAPQETLFSLLHKPYFEFSVPQRLRRSDFEPRPRVATVLLHARRRERPLLSTLERHEYERFVRGTFGAGPQAVGVALRARFSRRQVVRLARDLRFSPWQRASELTFPQWLALFRFAAQTRVGPHPLALSMCVGRERVGRRPRQTPGAHARDGASGMAKAHLQ
jgi:23S rRNA (adenine-N6)-dimethyltransferase